MWLGKLPRTDALETPFSSFHNLRKLDCMFVFISECETMGKTNWLIRMRALSKLCNNICWYLMSSWWVIRWLVILDYWRESMSNGSKPKNFVAYWLLFCDIDYLLMSLIAYWSYWLLLGFISDKYWNEISHLQNGPCMRPCIKRADFHLKVFIWKNLPSWTTLTKQPSRFGSILKDNEIGEKKIGLLKLNLHVI